MELDDADAAARCRAADVLGAIGPDARDAALPLVRLMKDKDPAVRADAVGALLCIEPNWSEVVRPLTELLDDPRSDVRGHAANLLALAGAAGMSSVERLSRVLANDDNENVPAQRRPVLSRPSAVRPRTGAGPSSRR